MESAKELYLLYEKFYDINLDIAAEAIAKAKRIKRDRVYDVEPFQRSYEYVFHGYRYKVKGKDDTFTSKEIGLSAIIPIDDLLELDIIIEVTAIFEHADIFWAGWGKKYTQYTQHFVNRLVKRSKDKLSSREDIVLFLALKGYKLKI